MYTNRTSFKIAAFVIVSVLLTYCKKEEPMTYFESKVDRDMLDKFMFNAGTYWVYEDEQTMELDSLVVLGWSTGFNTIPCPHGCPSRRTSRYEYFVMWMMSITNGNGWNYYFDGDWFKYNGGGEYGHLGQPIFMYNEPIGNEFNGARIVDQLDSLTILGNTYYEVTKMKITQAEQFDIMFSDDLHFYFSEHVGLIRKEKLNQDGSVNKTWNLKRYEIH